MSGDILMVMLVFYCWWLVVVAGISIALLVLFIVGVVLGAQESVAAGGKWRKPVADNSIALFCALLSTNPTTTCNSRQLYCSARACVLLSTTMLAVAADNFVALRVLELSVLCFLLLLLLHADQIIPDISIARASVLLSSTTATMANCKSRLLCRMAFRNFDTADLAKLPFLSPLLAFYCFPPHFFFILHSGRLQTSALLSIAVCFLEVEGSLNLCSCCDPFYFVPVHRFSAF